MKNEHQLILKKTDSKCAYCGIDLNLKTMTVDDVNPIVRPLERRQGAIYTKNIKGTPDHAQLSEQLDADKFCSPFAFAKGEVGLGKPFSVKVGSYFGGYSYNPLNLITSNQKRESFIQFLEVLIERVLDSAEKEEARDIFDELCATYDNPNMKDLLDMCEARLTAFAQCLRDALIRSTEGGESNE